MKHTIEYKPQISQQCQTYISNNINFVYSGEDTDIYSLDYVCEALNELVNQNEENDTLPVSLEDIKELVKLINEQVDYIEF